MGAFIIALGGVCFIGLVLVCGTYYTNRMRARWEEKIKQGTKQLAEAVLEYEKVQEELTEKKKQYNADSKF